MTLRNLRRIAARRRPAQPAPRKPPPQWPVDPDLARRVSEARARLERTRRELRRHVLPERQQRPRESESKEPRSHPTSQVLRTIGDRISDAATRTRERLEHVAVDDPVSCDLLVQVAATLEKQLWMVRAQMSDAARAIEPRSADANGTRRS